MALSLTDVEKIAKLSRLSLTEEEKGKTLSELNDIFAMVEKMQSVNTSRWHTPTKPPCACAKIKLPKPTMPPNIKPSHPKCATACISCLR